MSNSTHLGAEDVVPAHDPLSLAQLASKLGSLLRLAGKGQLVYLEANTRGDVGNTGDGALTAVREGTEEVVGSTAKHSEGCCQSAPSRGTTNHILP